MSGEEHGHEAVVVHVLPRGVPYFRATLLAPAGACIKPDQHEDRAETADPSAMSGLSLAIDIGGTFTDIVVYDPQAARHYIHKEYTTPDDPARGVLVGVAAVGSRSLVGEHARDVEQAARHLDLDRMVRRAGGADRFDPRPGRLGRAEAGARAAGTRTTTRA